MSNQTLEKLLSQLAGDDKHDKLLKALIEVRKMMDWPKCKINAGKLRESGCLKKIIWAVNNQQRTVVDVALSILGNVFMDAKCAREAITIYNILSCLNQTLKRYPREDSINGRVFRIIGNLCQHKDQWGIIILKKPQIVIHLVTYLKEAAESEEEDVDPKASEASLTMALRALRQILNRQTLKALVHQFDAIETVGMLLIKYATMCSENKKVKSVLANIIKLLEHYARYRYHPVLLKLKNTPNGDSIVYLSKILTVAPKEIVKILSTFVEISKHKSDLPIPQLFNNLIDLLKRTDEFNSFTEECIRGICMLLDNPANRNNERCGESIPFLINLLKTLTLDDNNKIECRTLILTTLCKCQFNKKLIEDQIECGVMNVIVDILGELVGPIRPFDVPHKRESYEHSQKTSAVRFCKRSPDTDEEDEGNPVNWIVKKRCMEDRWNKQNKIPRFQVMQETETSDSEIAVASTSGLSPASSPSSQIQSLTDSDSDDYSPVCSEADPADVDNMYSGGDIPSPDRIPSSNAEESTWRCESDGLPCGLLNISDASLRLPYVQECVKDLFRAMKAVNGQSRACLSPKERLFLQIISLTKMYANVENIRPHLANTELLLALIKGTVLFDTRYPRSSLCVTALVIKITQFYECLFPLMTTDFIPVVYELGGDLSHAIMCYKCKRLFLLGVGILSKFTAVAESDFGNGDLAHRLLRGDNQLRQQLALVIPYIIKNKSILMKLMVKCGGLEILLKLLQEDDNLLKERTIKAISVLATARLDILDPQNVNITDEKLLDDKVTLSKDDSSETVTFQLDDGSFIEANRTLLVKNSDFFSTLLNGPFKEAKEEHIALHQVTSESMRLLLKIMNLPTFKYVVEANVDLAAYLEVIALCDRYLMPQYCLHLTDSIGKYKLSSATAAEIYRWSVESRTNLLRVESVAFALVGDMDEPKRLTLFKSLFDLGYTEELLEDIKMLLLRHMRVD